MAKEFAKRFYNSAAWQKCRQSYIVSVFGLCERCGNPGYILHHKIKLTPDNINNTDITLNHANLEYLCHDCHNADVYGEHGNSKARYRFGMDGDILPP